MESLSPSVHSEFNASDADLVVQSVDNVQFRLHRKYVGANTGAFPGPEDMAVKSSTEGDADEVVQLTEAANVLEILFQFVYPREHPTLHDVEYDILSSLAEAVQKYEVFSAMYTCEVQLRQFIPRHGAQILGHAIKHNRARLMDETALFLMRGETLMATVAEKLPQNAIIPWIKYYEAWKGILDEERDRLLALTQNGRGCSACQSKRRDLPIHIIIDIESAKYAVPLNTLNSCVGCEVYRSIASAWEGGYLRTKLPILADILEGKEFQRAIRPIPPWSDF